MASGNSSKTSTHTKQLRSWTLPDRLLVTIDHTIYLRQIHHLVMGRWIPFKRFMGWGRPSRPETFDIEKLAEAEMTSQKYPDEVDFEHKK